MSLSEIPGWLRGSEMGAQIFAHDWAESGLGPVENWPPHLKLAVNIILLLPSATILLWGPTLIQIYNDPYRDFVRRWRPCCLGQPVRETWPEALDFLDPIVEGVMRRGQSYLFDEQRLVLNRNGIPEESFFKLTYSPVPGGLPGESVSNMAPPGGGAHNGGGDYRAGACAPARGGAGPAQRGAAGEADRVAGRGVSYRAFVPACAPRP